MATVSSHILDSVIGDHAGGIQVELFRLQENGKKEKIFNVVASNEGRIAETVDLSSDNNKYELVFHTAEYFSKTLKNEKQIIPEVVVRLTLDDNDEKYHIPMMLSPHSYSVWWSGR